MSEKQQKVINLPEREHSNEDYLIKQCAKRQWDCWKLTVPARRGVPDRLILADAGVIVLCEVKKKDGLLSSLQSRTLMKLSDRGMAVFVVFSKEDVDGLINFIEDAIKKVKSGIRT